MTAAYSAAHCQERGLLVLQWKFVPGALVGPSVGAQRCLQVNGVSPQGGMSHGPEGASSAVMLPASRADALLSLPADGELPPVRPTSFLRRRDSANHGNRHCQRGCRERSGRTHTQPGTIAYVCDVARSYICEMPARGKRHSCAKLCRNRGNSSQQAWSDTCTSGISVCGTRSSSRSFVALVVLRPGTPPRALRGPPTSWTLRLAASHRARLEKMPVQASA